MDSKWLRVGGGFLDSSVGRESACNIGDPSSIPGSGRSLGERDRLPIPVYWPGEFMDCIVHGLTKSQTRLNDFHFQMVCEMFRKVIVVF